MAAARGQRSTPDPFFVPGKQRPDVKPSGGGLTSFASHALHAVTSDVGKAAHYIGNAEHSHNVAMNKQFATRDAKGGPNDPFGSLVHLVGSLAKKTNLGQLIQHKGIYSSHPATISLKNAPHNQDAVTPPGLGILGDIASTFSLREGGLEALAKRLGGKSAIKFATEDVPSGVHNDVASPRRLPWVVNRATGRVTVGKIGDTHSDILYRLHGDNFRMGRGDYDTGWLNELDPTAAMLVTKAETRTASPASQWGTQNILHALFGRGSPYENSDFSRLRGLVENQPKQLSPEEASLQRLRIMRAKHGYRH